MQNHDVLWIQIQFYLSIEIKESTVNSYIKTHLKQSTFFQSIYVTHFTKFNLIAFSLNLEL